MCPVSDEMGRKVLAAMSGGVDSSVSAYLLLREGYDVIGSSILTCSSCAGVIDRAASSAETLGIPFHGLDVREEFERDIIEYFCLEYESGKTPNPCVLCNEKIKFGLLLRKAVALGAEYVATGHYVRLGYDKAGERYVLRKGRDRGKDQSYMLFSLSQKQLGHALFPLGNYLKSEVRKIASEAGLKYNREESQEICFIPDNDCAGFVGRRAHDGGRPGKIVDAGGNVLGEHEGLYLFTVGQRKGLGVNSGHPLYVLSIDSDTNTVVVGEEDALYKRELKAGSVNWVSVPPPKGAVRCHAKIRYKSKEAACTVFPLVNGVRVEFDKPQRAVTPGQAVVFYDEDTLLGGGWIERG